MSEDYYKILGVARTASQDEIEKAHRSLARKYHPDLNPDDASAKEKFQKVQKAFDVLKDPKSREMYDRFGDNYESVQGAGGQTFQDIDLSQLFGGGGEGGLDDLFRQFGGFQQGGGRQGRRGPARGKGRNIEHEVTIPFPLSVTGGDYTVAAPQHGGRTKEIRVTIPPGWIDGKKLRLSGNGAPGPDGPGDLMLRVRVAPHPHFKRIGDNLELDLPVSVTQAFLGAKVDVPTPYGTLGVTIKPGTSSGRRLRLPGYGVTRSDGVRGDLFVEIQIRCPESLTSEATELLRKLEEECPPAPPDVAW